MVCPPSSTWTARRRRIHRVLAQREQTGDLRDREDDDQVEEELEWRDSVLRASSGLTSTSLMRRR
jgi:hypothetical protein